MIRLPATVMHAQAQACLRDVQAQMDRGQGAVQLDAQALQAFDSSVLAVLLACRRQALSAGRAFEVLHMPERLQSLAHVYGVQGLLGH